MRYALTRHYAGAEDVYLAGNLFVYYKQGDAAASVAPDVFVVLGAARGRLTRGGKRASRRTSCWR